MNIFPGRRLFSNDCLDVQTARQHYDPSSGLQALSTSYARKSLDLALPLLGGDAKPCTSCAEACIARRSLDNFEKENAAYDLRITLKKVLSVSSRKKYVEGFHFL